MEDLNIKLSQTNALMLQYIVDIAMVDLKEEAEILRGTEQGVKVLHIINELSVTSAQLEAQLRNANRAKPVKGGILTLV